MTYYVISDPPAIILCACFSTSYAWLSFVMLFTHDPPSPPNPFPILLFVFSLLFYFLLNHFCLIWLSILLCKKLALHQNKMKDLWVFSCQMCLSLRVIYVYYISQWWPLISSQNPVLLGPSLLTRIPMFLISPGPPLTFLGSPWQNLIIDHYWYQHFCLLLNKIHLESWVMINLTFRQI